MNQSTVQMIYRLSLTTAVASRVYLWVTYGK